MVAGTNKKRYLSREILVSETRRKFPIFGIWDKVTVVHTATRTVGLRSPDRSRHPPDPDFTSFCQPITFVSCLLVIFNLTLVSHFPKQLSVGLINAVYKSGDKSNMSKYRGILVGSVIAKLFAMILDNRIAVWAKDEGMKAKGQAGFRKDFCTTDNIFVLKSLIDKQKQTRQGKHLENCIAVLLTSTRHFIPFLEEQARGLLWQVLERVGIRGAILDCIKSLYVHDSAAVRNSEGISEIFDCLLGV